MANPVVVVVDDDESIYEIVEATLSKLKITTVFFDNADDAIPYIAENQPDLVLMDLHLAFGQKGWDAIRVIKSDKTMETIPTVAFTAATGHHIRQAMQNGADNFLNKPFSLGQLRHIVDQYVTVPSD
ncbi:MAG: response regulator [Chloroflexota bacterium]